MCGELRGARVVDQAVDAPPAVERRLRQPPAVGIRGDVGLHDDGLAAERFARGGHGAGRVLAVPVVDRDPRAFRGEPLGARGADPGRRSRDDANRAVEFHARRLRHDRGYNHAHQRTEDPRHAA